MVSDFKVSPIDEEVGKYSGYLVASFMLGQFIFSYFWGSLSDIIGRRPVLLIGLALTGISFLSFGFSTSYEMALFTRFLTGSFNGIVGVTKTYMSEITDVTNQSQGFGIFGFSRGLGIVAGPIVGGFLSNPSKKFPYVFPKGSLFDK
jgi:MFS family permease